MSQGMKEIKKMIKSVNSTKEITRAMELVSSSKLRQARKYLEKVELYEKIVAKSITGLLPSIAKLAYVEDKKRERKYKLFIVITSDKGLAGGYNNSIVKFTEDIIEDKEHALVIPIGQKGIDYFTKNHYEIVESFEFISENPQFADAVTIGDIAIDLYKKHQVYEVNVVYTTFKNALSQIPVVLKLLPIETVEGENANNIQIECEPSPEAVLEYLISKFIHISIYSALVESSVSEQGARRMAMESATNNAEEMIAELELGYNRVRQTSITREITEIVGGVEALK
ncbi:ATP synthase F1 subunit gamma [Clostridium faecium]